MLAAEDILKEYKLLYRGAVRFGQSASLGRKSDYNGDVLSRMGVYSRTVDGGSRVPAQASVDAPPTPPTDASPARKPSPVRKSKAPVKEQETAPREVSSDRSAELLATMGEREKRVFEAIPMDTPIAIDRLQSTGYGTGDLLAALSLLEIKGLIQTLPGGLYCRA